MRLAVSIAALAETAIKQGVFSAAAYEEIR